MAVFLKILAWLFALAGIIAGFVLYPGDPMAPGFTLDSYTLAWAVQPAQRLLAWQVAISGIVAGIFTGALGCVLSVLEQILARIPQTPAKANADTEKESTSIVTL